MLRMPADRLFDLHWFLVQAVVRRQIQINSNMWADQNVGCNDIN